LSREMLWGLTIGLQRSKQVSKSIEFVEHREYQPGDPVTAIDWKVFARTDRLMIRRQQADTEANIILVLDASADMASASEGHPDLKTSKLGQAITVLGALTLYAQKRAEPVGLLVLGGGDIIHRWIPPSRRATAAIFHSLASLTAAGKAELHEGFEQLTEYLAKPSLIVAVSDWMEDPARWGKSLESLATYRHDIRALHLYSAKEWAFDLPENIRLFAKEGQEDIPLEPSSIRDDFLLEVRRYKNEVSEWAARSKAIWSYAALEDSLLLPLLRLIQGER